jgi:anti-sigma factor RsiW
MSEFDQLGEALREQLQTIVEDMHPSAELSAAVDALASAPRTRGPLRQRLSRRRRIAIAVPVPIAALAGAAVLLFGTSGVSSSIAGGIVVLRNGQVRITSTEISEPAVANALLARHHIHNIVVVPMTAACPNRQFSYLLGIEPNGPNRAPLDTLTPNSGTSGYTIVVAASQKTHTSVLTAFGRFKGTIPTCASSHGTGLGLGLTVPGNIKKLKDLKKAK